MLLTGGSSVGKTRCAAEAVKAVLPDWWLVHPAGPAEVAALATVPPARTVVWLDELQRYLDGEHGLGGGVIRALLGAPDPVLIIATLWPDRYNAYSAMPASGGTDPHARQREVLDLATVVRISPQFSPAEQGRTRAAAARDRRLAVALGADEYGLTQTLAAAPQLVARWEDAQAADPYGWAVLTAALDAARLGAHAPLSAGFLHAAAPGYCTPRQQAEASASWFEQALAYATARLHGATAALAPAGTGMGQVTGYTVADYLIQHASRERRAVRVPASTWDALISHVRDPADAYRLADSAIRRLLYCYAIPLSRHAAADGDRYASGRLAGLLAGRGDLDELRALADAGNVDAVADLARLLADRGDLDQAEQILRAHAGAGSLSAADQLERMLVARGDRDEADQILRAQADVGDEYAERRLALMLARRGDLDELRARAGAGDGAAAGQLAGLLARRGDLDQAMRILRTRAGAGDGAAARQLAGLLAGHGDLDQAMQILHALTGTGDEYAALELAGLLIERGDLDQAEQVLRTRADAGDQDAAEQLADLLAERGDLEGLRARANVGDQDAAIELARLLAERGDLKELRTRADAGDQDAAGQLARLLARCGDLDELRGRADAGDRNATRELARELAEDGDLDQAMQILRARAGAGDGDAAYQLAGLLARQEDLEGLRALAGDGDAALWLASLLAQRGDLDQAIQVQRGRAEVGDGDAVQLAELLTQQGRGEEAEQLHRFGLNPDGSTASR